MFFVSTSLPRISIILAAGVAVLASATSAASQCKGVEQQACSAAAECIWVNGYERKDGRSVKSHCKLKPGKKADTRASSGSIRLSEAK